MIDYCGIEDLGDISGLGDTLEWLVMPGNPQDDYDFLKVLPELELINLNDCNLTYVPDFTGNLSLEYLYLANNRLTELPDYLSVYPLKRIDASYNYLSDIPDSFINFARMEQLVLTDNLFRDFPREILTYKRLQVLMLGYNLLTDVSPGLGVLEDLQRLSFTSNDFTQLVTYSEFEIPFSYQLGFSYNRLNLDDEVTIEILEDNHNTGGIQKNGAVSAQCLNAETDKIEIQIDGDFANFSELKDIDYFVKEIVILDNTTKELLYIIDESIVDSDTITFTVNDTFTEKEMLDWELVLVLSIDTYPVTNLKYLSEVNVEVKPIATPVPTATPEATNTPEVTATAISEENKENASKIITLVIAGLLILAVVYVCYVLIRKHHKDQEKVISNYIEM